MTHQELHLKALEIASRYLHCEFELIEILQKIDLKKSYLSLGYKSLHEYAVRALKLSNDVSYYFIKVARVSLKVPELKAAIQTGAITVSQARQIAPVIEAHNAQDLITKAQELSQVELQKEVAQINPKAATPDKLKYISGSRLELRFSISEEVMKKFKRAQNIECQKRRTPVDFEAVLEGVLDIYLAKKDPVEKAKRALKLNELASNLSKTKKGANQTLITQKRTSIPTFIQHQLTLRDQAQCSYTDFKGLRCEERKWIHSHHIKEVSKGGTHELSNLKILCSNHHRLHHYQGH